MAVTKGPRVPGEGGPLYRTGLPGIAFFPAPNNLLAFADNGHIDGDGPWTRYDVSRCRRGMFDAFVARDMDRDGDLDFVGTRGNSQPFDGVFWLEQVRSPQPMPAFRRARKTDSAEKPLPPPPAR